MSVANLKWTKGKPEALIPGMVIRLTDKNVRLIGHGMSGDLYAPYLNNTVEYAQVIEGYTLDWLANMGEPAKLVKP